MKLLVLGANGRTGKHLVSQGLTRGHEIVALVRNVKSLSPRAGLTLIEGTPTRAQDLAEAAAGCDAILVALNNPRTSDAPWAKPLTTEPILTQVARHLTRLETLKRVVFLSALGVGDSFADSPWILRFLIKRTNLGYAYADHEGVERVFRDSDLAWTLVRASGLSDGTKEKSLVVGTAREPRPGMMIRRSTVADFMLDCVEADRFLRETPAVSEK